MKRISRIALGLVVGLGLIQLVSFERTNPPVTGEIKAPDDVKPLLERACYDCHSNQTVWPWYSRIAPGSWLMHRDVTEGRKELNFSEWASFTPERRQKKHKEMAEELEDGGMPPWFYLPLHSAAKLTPEERARLVAWAKGPVSD